MLIAWAVNRGKMWSEKRKGPIAPQIGPDNPQVHIFESKTFTPVVT